jgi:hypothetical protein
LVCSDIFHVLLGVVQLLDLSKARTRSWVLVVAQRVRMAELEVDHTRLQSEHEQARQALAEANDARRSLSLSREELE